MAIVGLVGTGMEVVDGMYAGQSLWSWSHVDNCLSISRVRGDTLMTPDHTTVPVRNSVYYPAGIRRSSWKGLNADAARRLRLVVDVVGWLHSCMSLSEELLY